MPIAVDPHRTFPRRFVPPEADLGDWSHIAPLVEALLAREVRSPDELEQWLLDLSELLAAIQEEGSRRYVAMTQQTDDPEREARYLHFVREIQPQVDRATFTLKRKYLESPHRHGLPRHRYFVLDRHTENDVALFREENVPLFVREAELEQQYQKVTGRMTVFYRGEERTLQQMAKFLDEPDRAVRQEAWELVARRRLRDREVLEDLYDALCTLRQQIARNAGFADYREYAFRARGRFDYTPEDCLRFHRAVEAYIVPVVCEIHKTRRRALGVERLRPWDLRVDPLGRPPLRPFARTQDLISRAGEVFSRVDPIFGELFRFMASQGLLDLENRKGKAPGEYQSTMHERRWPFIFMNTVGVEGDVRTLVHEGGHAFHTLLVRDEPLVFYRRAPVEFAEVASMGMEVLTLPHLDVFYPDPEDAARARRTFFEGIVRLLPWIATIDAFQHWVYTHPDHPREARREAWLEIHRRFQPDVDWSGYELERAYAWHAQLHLFLHPFYYIEYGIAQIRALQLWLAAQEDYAGTVRRYQEALSLGGSHPLPDLFRAAGLQFGLDEAVIAPLASALKRELGQ